MADHSYTSYRPYRSHILLGMLPERIFREIFPAAYAQKRICTSNVMSGRNATGAKSRTTQSSAV